ncbi:MAG: hypothetical protein GDA54_01715 [Alphaproteobacteria bacterium GM7ARS4]|nr:hypothetical protein [Alphaproteobacteria bacterium GM7ARS4]
MPSIIPSSKPIVSIRQGEQLLNKSKITSLKKDSTLYVSTRGTLVVSQKKKANFFARVFLGRKVKTVYTPLSPHRGQRKISKRHLLTGLQSRVVIAQFLKEQANRATNSTDNPPTRKQLKAREITIPAIRTYLDLKNETEDLGVKPDALILIKTFIDISAQKVQTESKTPVIPTTPPSKALNRPTSLPSAIAEEEEPNE